MADEPDDAGRPFNPLGDVLGSGDGAADSAPEEPGHPTPSPRSRASRGSNVLMEAAVGVIIGLVLVLATVVLLFWNEGRAVQTERSLAEGAGLMVDVDPGRVDPANEGRLVHVMGDLGTTAPLVDPDFGVSAQAARLVRSVEMYQWKEESHSETHKKLGGGEETVTRYSYVRVWSDRRIESGSFRQRGGHDNPQMRFGAFETAARDAALGAFRPGPAALEHLPAREELRVDPGLVETLRAKLGSVPAHVADGRIYLGADPAQPRIGDLRVSYHVAPTGPVSLIGRQAGADIAAFQTRAGDRLLIAASGLVPASEMFRQAEQENRILTWILRLVGTVFLWVGWFLILRPIAVVGDLVPMIGNVLSAGAGLAALLLTLLLAPLVIGTAWLWSRPLLSVGLIAAGFAAAYGVRTLARRRAAQTARAPAAAARAA